MESFVCGGGGVNASDVNGSSVGVAVLVVVGEREDGWMIGRGAVWNPKNV